MIKKTSHAEFPLFYTQTLFKCWLQNYQIRNTVQDTSVIDNRQNITVFVKDNTGSSRTQDPRNKLNLCYEKENQLHRNLDVN